MAALHIEPYHTEIRPRRVDLHLHTVVSPCAEVEMIPPLIVERALELDLDAIAVTDHNTAENVAAVQRAASGTGLQVIPGMEVQTREEVHVLCLFDTLEQIMDWQEFVYAHLPPLKNREQIFGAQFVVDETGDFIRMNERLLLTSTDLSIERVVEQVCARSGLAIAAHVDRQAFSLLASLGFVPEGLQLAALEITHRITRENALERFPQIRGWPLISSGDAHRLSEIRVGTIVMVDKPITVRKLAMAFTQQQGHSIVLSS